MFSRLRRVRRLYRSTRIQCGCPRTTTTRTSMVGRSSTSPTCRSSGFTTSTLGGPQANSASTTSTSMVAPVDGELFPSVNGGTIDVTGAILSAASCEAPGLTAWASKSRTAPPATPPTPRNCCRAVNSPTRASRRRAHPRRADTCDARHRVDRSIVAFGTYESEVPLINDSNPFDPDNIVGRTGPACSSHRADDAKPG